MKRFVRKLYTIDPQDDVKLQTLARISGTGNKSAELRTLIRREYKRVMETQRAKIDHDDGQSAPLGHSKE